MKENKIAGVYKITNIITGDFYIGSSKDIKYRWAIHKCVSVWKQRPGMKLYQAFIKYGLNSFTFDIIEETTDLHNRQQYYIEQLKPAYNDRHADGIDVKRRKETSRQCCKEWHKVHRDEQLAKKKDYNNRLCLYEDETLTLNTLSARFRKQGIAHPYKKAMKYLL